MLGFLVSGVSGFGFRIMDGFHTADYDPYIKSQLASTQLTVEPYVVQIWSRNPRIFEATNPSKSAVWHSVGLKIWGSEVSSLRVPGSGFRVPGQGFRAEDFGYRDLVFRIQGLAFRAEDLLLRHVIEDVDDLRAGESLVARLRHVLHGQGFRVWGLGFGA